MYICQNVVLFLTVLNQLIPACQYRAITPIYKTSQSVANFLDGMGGEGQTQNGEGSSINFEPVLLALAWK